MTAPDPVQLLREAGAECHALVQYQPFRNQTTVCNSLGGFPVVRQAPADAAILALAELVAKYKWMAEFLIESERAVDMYYIVPEAKIGDYDDVMRCLDARWEQHRGK
jgi:hypothetical protein